MMGIEDLYICTDDMREHLIAWITQAQSYDQSAATLSYNKEHHAAALLMIERDVLIGRIRYVQEWADTHTEYPGDSTFKIPKDATSDRLSTYEWWFKYGAMNPVDLAEVIW